MPFQLFGPILREPLGEPRSNSHARISLPILKALERSILIDSRVAQTRRGESAALNLSKLRNRRLSPRRVNKNRLCACILISC